MNENFNDENKKPEEEIEINDKNCIMVGHKETNIYVLFALRQLTNNGNKEVTLKARGNLIPRCITIALILKSNYIKDLNFRISVDSELLQNEYIPNISIRLSKFSCIL
jgi:DNA-binding protein Alba